MQAQLSLGLGLAQLSPSLFIYILSRVLSHSDRIYKYMVSPGFNSLQSGDIMILCQKYAGVRIKIMGGDSKLS